MLENENNIQNETALACGLGQSRVLASTGSQFNTATGTSSPTEEASAGIADAAETEEVSQARVEAVHSAQGTVNSEGRIAASQQVAPRNDIPDETGVEDGRIRDVLDQAVALAEKIPGFDLALEMKDPVFGHLVYAGVPVEQAFIVTHMDLLMDVMAKNIARDTEAKISASIASGMTRPVENTESAPIQPQHDIRDKAYRDEIKKRVFEASVRGEKVYPE